MNCPVSSARRDARDQRMPAIADRRRRHRKALLEFPADQNQSDDDQQRRGDGAEQFAVDTHLHADGGDEHADGDIGNHEANREGDQAEGVGGSGADNQQWQKRHHTRGKGRQYSRQEA